MKTMFHSLSSGKITSTLRQLLGLWENLSKFQTYPHPCYIGAKHLLLSWSCFISLYFYCIQASRWVLSMRRMWYVQHLERFQYIFGVHLHCIGSCSQLGQGRARRKRGWQRRGYPSRDYIHDVESRSLVGQYCILIVLRPFYVGSEYVPSPCSRKLISRDYGDYSISHSWKFPLSPQQVLGVPATFQRVFIDIYSRKSTDRAPVWWRYWQDEGEWWKYYPELHAVTKLCKYCNFKHHQVSTWLTYTVDLRQ